jgi:hypothetical protein
MIAGIGVVAVVSGIRKKSSKNEQSDEIDNQLNNVRPAM